MKKYISIVFLFVVLFSCKKQSEQLAPPPPRPGGSAGYLTNVMAYLKANLYDSDYNAIDTNNAVLSVQPGGSFLRIGLLNKSLSSDFILLRTDIIENYTPGNPGNGGNGGNAGICGKFIHCRHDTTPVTPSTTRVVRASISIETLKHESSVKHILTNGVVTSACEGSQNEESISEEGGCAVVPACDGCLPEVLVVGYIPSDGGGGGGDSYSEYLNLATLIGVGSSSSTGSSAGSGSGTLTGVYSPAVVPDNPTGTKLPVRTSADITVTYDQTSSKPAITVAAYMECFTTIPDAGASCSVTLFDDLPVNDNPSYIFNILSGATGHTFLQLTKTNGSQSITQIVGFTSSKPLAILGLPVPGKIVDNTGHKYNASLTMNITPAQFQTEINTINTLGSVPKYDMWEYNCVNYAVNVLNAIRSTNPLKVILLNDVTSGDSYSTPQGLYMTLDQMKQANGPEAKNITVDVVNKVGTSHGACDR